MSCRIWVYAESDGEHVVDVVYELLGKATQLAENIKGASVEAVLAGNEVYKHVPRLAKAGADVIYLAQDPRLEPWSPLSHVPLLTDLVKKHTPDIVLFGATEQGANVAPALAARLRTGMAAHCMDLRVDAEGRLVSLVPAFGGKVAGEILCPRTRPQMASVKPGIFSRVPVARPGCGRVVMSDLSCLDDLDLSLLKPLGGRCEKPAGVPLNKADLVLCGGFGVSGKENWKMLEELAFQLGGAVACTRPPVDEGWVRESSMVGTSGRNIRPKFYLGFGISGATHHICGMKDSACIVNVNTDHEAPVFDVSDVRIVADAGAVLSALLNLLSCQK